MMICSNCKTLNFRDYKYCRECGRPLPRPALGASDVTRMQEPGGHPQDEQVRALLERAFAAFEAGETTDARLACQSALALRGESSAAHSLLGLIYEREGKIEEAIRQFEQVLALNPDSDADRAHLERLQARARSHGSRLPAWLGRQRAPLLAGGLTAAVVLVAGLWMAAGALRPPAREPAAVAPSNLRTARGAPGAVAPTAGSVRLPPPPIARPPASGAWSTPTFGSTGATASASGLGVPVTEGMNARMQALAPRLFGAQTSPRPPVPTPLPSRTRPLSPAPVRVSGLEAAPRSDRASGVPVLPDARGVSEPTPSPPPPAAEEVDGRSAPATPPVVPSPPAEREEPAESSSYIRIRPLTGEESAQQNHAPPVAAAARAPRVEEPRPAAPAPVGGPTLAEARLHLNNALNFWRQRDYAAAHQEYEYAAQLYRLIAARCGPDAAGALEGLRAAEQGMRASGGQR